MKKKLSSALLVALLLSRTTLALPINEQNIAENQSIHTQELHHNQGKRSCNFISFIKNTVFAGALAFLSYYFYNCFNSNPNESQSKEPKDAPKSSQEPQQPEIPEESKSNLKSVQPETPKKSKSHPAPKNPRTSKKSKAEPMQSNVSEEPKTTVRSRRRAVHPQRMVIEDLRNNQVACSTPIPLRSIAWHGNRCWFHASLLHFYHNKIYHDFVTAFPTEEAKQLILSESLDEHDRSALETMTCLSETFKILDGDSQNPNYRKPQVVFLGAKRENDLITKLSRFNNLVMLPPLQDTLKTTYTEQNTCELVLHKLLVQTAQCAQKPPNYLLSQNWPGILNTPIFKRGSIPNLAPIKHGDILDDSGKCVAGHFWVETTHNGVTFEIGKSIAHSQAINIKVSGSAAKSVSKKSTEPIVVD